MTQNSFEFSERVLAFDVAAETERICDALRKTVQRFKRKGIVLGISGGIDSSVCAALSVRALGPERVLGLKMPEGESAAAKESQELAQLLADHLGIETLTEDITPTLNGVDCYARRDAALQEVLPEYGAGWKCKIVLPNVVESDRYRTFSVVAQAPSGEIREARLSAKAYLGVVAATNFKQRARKMIEYYHAERLQRIVVGTPNRLEYDQGFFVKGGDGVADIKPIAHLYKTQVYRLAEQLEIPALIQRQPPTTDTYSLPQSQEEFYFSLPYTQMDLCLWGLDHRIPAARVGEVLGLRAEQVERVYRDIDGKRKMAAYLLCPPLLVAHDDVA